MKKTLQVWAVGCGVIAIAFTSLVFCSGGISNWLVLIAIFLVCFLSAFAGGIWFFFVFALYQEAQDSEAQSKPFLGDVRLVPGDPSGRQNWQWQ
jgi:hypothetical protein